MVRARRVSLFEREVRERLSVSAIEILLGAAKVLSEGRLDPGNPALAGRAGGSAYFGSTMLTIDLSALSRPNGRGVLREACDELTVRRLATLAANDARLLRRVRQIAEREASRLASRRFSSTACEVRVRAEGSVLFVDADVEGELMLGLRVVHGGRAGGR